MQPLTDEQKQFAEKNHNLIYEFCHKRNLQLDEWYGIIAVGFLQAIPTWNPQRASFATWAFYQMLHEYSSEMKKIKRRQHIAIAYSLNATIPDTNDGIATFGDIIPDTQDNIDRICSSIDAERFISTLSEHDYTLLMYATTGMNQTQIGEKTGHTQVQVSRAIRKLKLKFIS